MSKLTIQVFSDKNQSMLLADYSDRAQNVVFNTSPHGFGTCSWFVEMNLVDGFMAYEWPHIPHVILSDNGGFYAFEGRLEDIGIVEGGVEFVAFGYWRAFTDAPYTALWSYPGTSNWRVLNQDDYSNAAPEKYKFDNNNRLYIAITKGEESSSALQGTYGFLVPDNGERSIVAIDFDYELVGASGYTARCTRRDGNFGHLSNEWILTTNGTTQTGSQSLTFSDCNALDFRLYYDSGTATEFTDETGDTYLKITNVRVKTTTASSVLASDITAALVTYINGINSNQLSSSTALIEATSTDLQNEWYEDLYPNDIIDELAARHNYRASVWENQQLVFGPKDSGRTWHIDVTQITQLQRSLANLFNSAYGVYQDVNRRALRTAVSNDSQTQSNYGVTRRGFISSRTTSQTQAETYRDAFLVDGSSFVIRASIEFERLYDEHGAPWPLYALRSGDTVVMRNLPPTLSTNIDNIRSFRIASTSYDADTNGIQIEPEIPVPTLVTLMAGV